VSKNPAAYVSAVNDRLQADIERTRKHRAELEAEHGDLEAYVDRFSEEMFGSPEAAQVLFDDVLRRSVELDPEADHEDLSDFGGCSHRLDDPSTDRPERLAVDTTTVSIAFPPRPSTILSRNRRQEVEGSSFQGSC